VIALQATKARERIIDQSIKSNNTLVVA